MAADVAPALQEEIMKLMRSGLANDREFQRLCDKLAKGRATYEDTHKVSQVAGEHASRALQKVLRPDALPDRRLYYNIADRTMRPAMEYADTITANYAQTMQTQKNRRAGTNVKAIVPRENTEGIDNICGLASDYEDFEDGLWVLDKPVQTHVETVVDRFVRANAFFAARSGMHPKIVRVAEIDCCPWCAGLEGIFDYGTQPSEVYARHNNCRCVTDYEL